MEIRIFQIVVPLIALFFIFGAIFHYHKSKITIYETALRVAFWLAALLVAFFPDFFSNGIARIFGIRSNVNAIIFFCLGILFFIQFKMYFAIRKLEKNLTVLTRQLALRDHPEDRTP